MSQQHLRDLSRITGQRKPNLVSTPIQTLPHQSPHTSNKKTSQTPSNLLSFTCEICSRTFNDSLSYADHMVSKAHLKAIGADIVVTHSTTEEVRERILSLAIRKGLADASLLKKREREEVEEKAGGGGGCTPSSLLSDADREREEAYKLLGFKSFGG
eukprot:PhF_6_TR6751/c0_g1_i1/m.9753/K12848/SNU23; U4/U6.U5 tri-snRNP component SNU23